MNKIFYSILLFAGVCIAVAACSSGAYVANPAANANGSINPLNPLKYNQFTWAGTAEFSVNINGSQWVADTAYVAFVDSLQTNYVYAQKGSNLVKMWLSNVWGGNVYNMGFKVYSCIAQYTDSISSISGYYISALGNSGEFCMNTNDSIAFNGQFYFQGVNSIGTVYNFSNGYFNLTK